jgi:tetratricopeptide (TPR) repeat protein
MKNKALMLLLAGLLAALCAMPAWSQAVGTVKGTALGVDGKPLVGATIQYQDMESGRKYDLLTNNKGEFQHIAIAPGKYKVNIIQNGNQIFFYSGVPVQAGINNVFDIDLSKEQAAANAKLSPEEQKKRQEIDQQNQKIRGVNALLAQASQAEQAGNIDQALQLMGQASEQAPNIPLVWARLGEANMAAAKKDTDKSSQQAKYKAAADAYEHALSLPANSTGALKPPDQVVAHIGAAEALARLGDDQKALDQCSQGAAISGPDSAKCYYNIGAILTMSGKVDDANAAFDKSIQLNPQYAEAYYQKAINLMGKATLNKDGTMNAPPEVAQNFNKYLELAPSGPNAETAKQMLASLGEKVETSYGKKKK